MIWRPVEKRPRGRPRIRWKDIRRIGIENWRGRPGQKPFEKLRNTAE
jgi:hypothetical protein